MHHHCGCAAPDSVPWLEEPPEVTPSINCVPAEEVCNRSLRQHTLSICSDDGDMLVSNLRNTHLNLANKEIFHAILYRPLDFEQPPWPSISGSAKDLVQRLLTRDPGEIG